MQYIKDLAIVLEDETTELVMRLRHRSQNILLSKKVWSDLVRAVETQFQNLQFSEQSFQKRRTLYEQGSEYTSRSNGSGTLRMHTAIWS